MDRSKTTIFETEDEAKTPCKLEIDEKGNLYWKGDRILTEQKVKLDRLVSLSIIIGGFSTLIIALFTALPCICSIISKICCLN
jgi:hypothetical protein